MSSTLTKRRIDAVKPAAKDQFSWDTDPRGFGLKVTPTGRKVFIFQYRVGGRGSSTKRITLGKYGDLTVEEARTRARRLAGQVADGQDPSAEIRDKKRKDADEGVLTFEVLMADFVEQYAKRHQRNWQETERLLVRDALPVLRQASANAIRRAEIHQLLHDVSTRAPITANRLLAALRKMFNWAVATGKLDASPVNGMPPIAKERPRERVLSDDELARILNAAKATGYPFGPFVELLVLTGQRRDEVAGMRWSEIDGTVWSIAAERSKNGKGHVVHLSEKALRVLKDIERRDGVDLVFSTNGRTPISGFSKAKQTLDKHAGVTNWRLHDIRRTVTTGLANLGHPPHVADKILNHTAGTISGVAAVYQRAEFLKEREAALADWGRHVEGLQSEDL